MPSDCRRCEPPVCGCPSTSLQRAPAGAVTDACPFVLPFHCQLPCSRASAQSQQWCATLLALSSLSGERVGEWPGTGTGPRFPLPPSATVRRARRLVGAYRDGVHGLDQPASSALPASGNLPLFPLSSWTPLLALSRSHCRTSPLVCLLAAFLPCCSLSTASSCP